MCVIFSESVIRNHRGPVWRVVTTPVSFLNCFSTCNTIHAFSFFFFIYKLKLKLNARSANKLYFTYERINYGRLSYSSI